MTALQDQLQSAFGDTYRLEGELGGGGMSRVFLAEEVRLGRKVVIKVLPPEMAAGVSIERFERETQLAASLQHPHIVPLLTAGRAPTATGADSDLLYYVMPFIEGESLRAKLMREGELPIDEALRILKEVVDALAYAHEAGVVHRDIKPDNVMLSRNHALVTDFGVAKAVTASEGSASSLTSLGVALGTPAYMSPEQAAADPHVDHRADIYAVGALAYEMLTGRPPFVKQTPQQVLAAQVAEAPEPMMSHRATIPLALDELVMRCLAKRAADRWQNAGELRGHFETMTTPMSGGMTPTGSQPVLTAATGAAAAAAPLHPARVAALFGGAAVATLVITYAMMIAFGLPDWVLVGAIALLVIGIPIIMVTGKHERARAVAATTGLRAPTPTGMQRHLTWRKATFGGGMAFAGLAVVAGGYMGMRTLGIGPAGTLMAEGVFEEQERLILAEFENRTTDTTLGRTVTELFRIDLAQSPALVVLEPTQLDQILRHMERPPGTRITPQLAQEAAEREGIKGYITGEIVAVGNSFALTGRLIGVATGDALVSHSERAANADEIIDAVDRLSAKFRERIGESLRTVRRDPPLERVTTASMEALRLYAQGSYVGSATADYDRGIQLLEQAVELDTTFAMAYRKLAAWSGNAGHPEEADSAAARAFALRARVGDRERWLIEAAYHDYVTDDDDAEENAYLSLLDKYPNDRTALNNQASNYRTRGQRAEAVELLTRSVRNGGAPGVSYAALISDLGDLGELDELETILADFQRVYPSHPNIGQQQIYLAYHRGQLDSAEQMARRLRDDLASGPPQIASGPITILARLAFLRGRLADGARYDRESTTLAVEFWRDRVPEMAENIAMFNGFTEVESALWYQVGPAITTERVERELTALRAALPDSMIPYGDFAEMFSRMGRSERASEMLAIAREQAEAGDDPPEPWSFKDEEGTVALAAGDPVRAGRLYREFRDEAPFCNLPVCMLFEIGTAFDSAGVTDSAIHYFERHLNEPAWSRLFTDARERPVILRRLGELYEERGDRERATQYYADFVDLWANADPALQPIVQDVRARIARLAGEGR